MRTMTRWSTVLSRKLRRPLTRQRIAKGAVLRLLSGHTTFRGSRAPQDGRVTLLTVDFLSTDFVRQLIRSFRRYVDESGPVVVVQNGPLRASRTLRREGVRAFGLGANLGHGLALDLGLRWVRTEYTLICDPDCVILSDQLWPELKSRVDKYGAASIDNGAAIYHPICLAFRTNTWKARPFSMQEKWPQYDVAGALTEVVGGLNENALLPRTRHAGPPIPSARQGRFHYFGEVYGEAVSNTYGGSRKAAEPTTVDFEGWSRGQLVSYHQRWSAWAARIASGTDDVTHFPES